MFISAVWSAVRAIHIEEWCPKVIIFINIYFYWIPIEIILLSSPNWCWMWLSCKILGDLHWPEAEAHCSGITSKLKWQHSCLALRLRSFVCLMTYFQKWRATVFVLVEVHCTLIHTYVRDTPPYPHKKWQMHKNLHMKWSHIHTRWALTHTYTHTQSGVSQSSLLCCSSMWDSCWGCHWTQSVTQRKRGTEMIRVGWEGSDNEKKKKYIWRAGEQEHTPTHLSLYQLERVFTDTRDRAQQQGELNVIKVSCIMLYILTLYTLWWMTWGGTPPQCFHRLGGCRRIGRERIVIDILTSFLSCLFQLSRLCIQHCHSVCHCVCLCLSCKWTVAPFLCRHPLYLSPSHTLLLHWPLSLFGAKEHSCICEGKHLM